MLIFLGGQKHQLLPLGGRSNRKATAAFGLEFSVISCKLNMEKILLMINMLILPPHPKKKQGVGHERYSEIVLDSSRN
jgi:hypothetical protein